MNINVETRWGAFAIHLVISVLALLLLLGIIFFIWFPHGLIFAGGIDGLKILTGVDLVLGPLLTLIVFNKAKKSLKMDLILIGLFQAVCMAGGLWLIYNERPLTQVIADDGVHLHTQAAYNLYELEQVDLPGPSPKYALLDLPDEPSQVAELAITTNITGSAPLNMRTDLFLPMRELDEQRYHDRIALIRQLLTDPEIEKLDALPKLGCDWLPVHSVHVTGHACTTYEDGVVRLSNRKLY